MSYITLKCEECGGKVIAHRGPTLIHEENGLYTCPSKKPLYMDRPDLAESVAHIKKTMEIYPGLLLGLPRQVGKTQAILEIIHDVHEGEAIYFCPTRLIQDISYSRYRDLYPDDCIPLFTSDPYYCRGTDTPIYVDEWWMISASRQDELRGFNNRIKCRIGTDNW